MGLLKSSPERQLTPRQIEHRRQIFKRGRKHFLFYRGVLGFGLPSAAVFALLQWLSGQYRIVIQRPTWVMVTLAVSEIAIWSVVGILWAAIMWKLLFANGEHEFSQS
jgi:hypothetical protein